MDQQQSYRLIQSSDGQNRGQIMISDQINRNQDETAIQHVVYSQQMNSGDQQQIYYQVQQTSQPQQQVYYQIQNQNNADHQNMQHSVSLNRTMPNQQHKIVIQPKVVVQRNPDLSQPDQQIIIDQGQQQNIQYNFLTQMEQNPQQPHLIQIQPQQIKQTIYPQQTGQVVMQPQYYNTQQSNIVGTTKIVMQAQPNQVQRFYIRPPQQQQQLQQIMSNQVGQIVQINQQQPRMVANNQTNMKVRLPNTPRLVQMNVGRPRIMRPTMAQKIVRPSSPANQNVSTVRSTTPSKQTVYIIQHQSDGGQVLVNPQNQPVIRPMMVQQRIVPVRPTQDQQSPQFPSPSVENAQPSSSSSFSAKKESDSDDLENSITATTITKGPEPPPLVPQRQLQTPNRIGLVGNQTKNSQVQIIRKRNPQNINLQARSVNQISERESAKMLVILSNGEQRLITFTLPKETCTVQELLDQVGINVGPDSNLECIENHDSEIDYVVKVGNFSSKPDTFAIATKAAEIHIKQRNQLQQQQQQKRNETPSKVEVNKSLPPKKEVAGFLAVCIFCGICGSDHAKCERCHRIFETEPKTIPITHTFSKVDKKDQIEALQKKHQIKFAAKHANVSVRPPVMTPRAARIVKPRKPLVPEIVTLLSSDEEDENDKSINKSSSQANINVEEKHVKKSFEPIITEEEVPNDFVRRSVVDCAEDEQLIVTKFQCRTIRIGTYKFETSEKAIMTSKGIRIFAPSVENPKESIILDIQHSEIVKLVAHFSKQLSVMFLYTKPNCARYICEQLSFNKSNSGFIYNPLSREEQQRKIIFLPHALNEETKGVVKSLYALPIFEEITNKDANELLLKSSGYPGLLPTANDKLNESNNSQDNLIKKLFIYPPGRGGISITIHDYLCLGSDQYLNDVIIDFYLKYIEKELITNEQRNRVHIFSQFFYKRLTTMTREKDVKLTAAEKRWKRVSAWTKQVNIFEKDFIIVPINEQSHWFLAIICFPSLKEPHTMETNQPIKLIPMSKKKKIADAKTLQIGNTTITPLKTKEETVQIQDDESERDEAEGDESDLDSNNETDEEVVDEGQPVKVPCILIFDSLTGAPRSRVVATLRDYLTCEYKAKYPDQPPRAFTKDNLLGSQCKVPQQNNFIDCGLFLLQYVEQFFKDPIKDFRIPIKTLTEWFPHDVVTRKREEIANLIKDIIKREVPEGIQLPEIEFPTKDGIITEQNQSKTIDSAFDEKVENTSTVEESNGNDQEPKGNTKKVYLSRKRVIDRKEHNGDGTSPKTAKTS